MYHISDRDDGFNDDVSNSRSFPSRTTWGAGFSLEEKHPHLFETHWFTKAWGYWDGYTIAQIELMALDTPIVSYDSSRKGQRSGKRKRPLPEHKDLGREMEELSRRWNADRKGKTFAGKKVTVGDIFGE